MMRMVDIIEKKRNGGELSNEEIQLTIQRYTKGKIPDYQMSALAMAIYFQNMSTQERAALTKAMVASGDQIDLGDIQGRKVDKHSTGGVGDTTTLVLAPLVASLGVPFAKMSGRGLGHTGGTIDKLESIPGFRTEMDQTSFIHLVNKNHVAVVGQSGNLTPADKKLYGLRDVTATVEAMPLIASSIMSKKIAAGADAIVLDVKTGSGAFMKHYNDAKTLADAMVQIGNQIERQTMAVISDMSQPLGFAVGNALEVKEAIDTLKGEGPNDLMELCLTLGSHMVVSAQKASSVDQARAKLKEAIDNGDAINTMRTLISSQGGDPSVLDKPSKLPQADETFEIKAIQNGTITTISADEIGKAAMLLGAGRTTKDSSIDKAVGIVLHKKIADTVYAGETIATIHSNGQFDTDIEQRIHRAFQIHDRAVSAPQFIYEEVYH